MDIDVLFNNFSLQMIKLYIKHKMLYTNISDTIPIMETMTTVVTVVATTAALTGALSGQPTSFSGGAPQGVPQPGTGIYVYKDVGRIL